MSFKIGRFSTPRTASASLSGRTLSVSGTFQSTNSAAAIATRQRLAGYVDNPDEPVVPVTWDKDPTVDGYYRVVDADVTWDQQRSYTTNGQFNYIWSAQLEQVEGYAVPRIESVIRGTLRSNSHSILTSNLIAFHAVHQTAAAYDIFNYDLYSASAINDEITTEDGEVERYRNPAEIEPVLLDAQVGWSDHPQNHYKSACQITVGGEPVVGRQIENRPFEVELSNKIMKVTVATNGVTCSWLTTNGFKSIMFVTGQLNPAWTTNTFSPQAITVLRNSPEVVSARWTLSPDRTTISYLDVSLRRGAAHGEFLSVRASAEKQGVSRFTNEIVAPFFGSGSSFAGIRATNEDANGLQFIVVTPGPNLRSSNEGRLYLGTNEEATIFPFGIGAAFGGAGGFQGWEVDEIARAYFVTGTELQSVQAR